MDEAGEDPALNADKLFEGGGTCRAVRYRKLPLYREGGAGITLCYT